IDVFADELRLSVGAGLVILRHFGAAVVVEIRGARVLGGAFLTAGQRSFRRLLFRRRRLTAVCVVARSRFVSAASRERERERAACGQGKMSSEHDRRRIALSCTHVKAPARRREASSRAADLRAPADEGGAPKTG